MPHLKVVEIMILETVFKVYDHFFLDVAPLYKLGGVFPTWALVVLLGLLIGGAVFVTSANDRPPCYHWVCRSRFVLSMWT